MGSRSWNKFTAASSALAAAGVLACTVAILDVFLPKTSAAAFLASMALLALVVTGVMFAYNWACDKFDSRFNGQFDRLIRAGMPDRKATFVPRTAIRVPRRRIQHSL